MTKSDSEKSIIIICIKLKQIEQPSSDLRSTATYNRFVNEKIKLIWNSKLTIARSRGDNIFRFGRFVSSASFGVYLFCMKLHEITQCITYSR